MGSSVRVQAPDQPLRTPEDMAVVQVKEVVGNLRPAISAVAVKVQVTEVVESLKRVTSVVAEAARMPWVALGMEEANVLPVIEVRRAGALPRAALAVRGVRGAAAAVDRAAVEEPPVAVVGEQEIKKNKY